MRTNKTVKLDNEWGGVWITMRKNGYRIEPWSAYQGNLSGGKYFVLFSDVQEALGKSMRDAIIDRDIEEIINFGVNWGRCLKSPFRVS